MSQLDPRLDLIFTGAVAIADSAERAAFVDHACGGEEPLRREVEALLAAHDGAGQFMKATQAEEATGSILSEKAGDLIGRYKLLEQIGEGGFGVVWMAEQEEPVRRRVALKIIKLGMDTRQVVARFEAERQALAMMDHPCIARVFDGGATETGRPYFVMELVRGVRITDYCDANKLSTPDRLGLFIQVCQAVQHAHQKGIIHRDLKPSNILVTEQDGKPVPKVIDFGVAKATQARLTDRSFFTGLHQVIGTPAYMSPEQAGLGTLDVDTRSDVYALGVLLYELLTGRTPFTNEEFEKAGLDQMLRLIREQDPPKPSTRLSTLTRGELTTIAAQRQAEAVILTKLVRGELDWITVKALEKDRDRRYESAAALAADVEHHLKHEPVTAAAPGPLYTLRKFAQRHRVILGVAAVIVILLIGMSVLGLRNVALNRRQSEMAGKVRAEDARREREQAEHERERLAQKLELQQALLESRERELLLNRQALSIVLGKQNHENGLRLRRYDDGVTEPTTVGASECHRLVRMQKTGASHVYFSIHPGFKWAEVMDVVAMVEYFDDARRDGVFQLQYDRAASGSGDVVYSPATNAVPLAGRGSWQTAVFYLDGARFPQSQNARADFRLFASEPEFYVRRVTVVGRRFYEDHTRDIPRRDPITPAALLDLSDHFNASLGKEWLAPVLPGCSFYLLPSGLQRFVDVDFEIRGIVQLNSAWFASQPLVYPTEVKGVRVAQRCRRLNFLHGTVHPRPDGTPLLEYVIYYADGQTHRIPYAYGQDMRDARGEDKAPVILRSYAAWQESNSHFVGRLFLSIWENPRPDVEILTLDVVSAMSKSAPFVIAITAEPVKVPAGNPRI